MKSILFKGFYILSKALNSCTHLNMHTQKYAEEICWKSPPGTGQENGGE